MPMATSPTFLLMRAVGGGLGFKSSPDGDSIWSLGSLMAALHLRRLRRAAEAELLRVRFYRSLLLVLEQFLPWSGACRLQEEERHGRTGDPRCRYCLSRGN